MTEAPSSSQLILGTDKRNPLFTVYQEREHKQLHVYYGLELMEKVPDERENPAFKLMVGRLYNGGVKAKSLGEVFEVDRKTMQRWGQALCCGDGAQLVRMLEGRSACRKLTTEIKAYVRVRWPEVVKLSRSGCSQRLCQEIKAVFQVQLSTETLRPLIRELKAAARAPGAGELSPSSGPREAEPSSSETSQAEANSLPAAPPTEGSACAAEAVGATGSGKEAGEGKEAEASGEKRETSWACAQSVGAGEPLSKSLTNNQFGGDPTLTPVPGKPKTSAVLPAYPPVRTLWCDHAGVLVFSGVLNQVSHLVDPPQPVLRQWLASLWSGAVNIEQTKFLNLEDLEMLLGTVVRFPTPQREQLKQLATEEAVGALLRLNAQQLGAAVGPDLYFDPHTKHYTGGQNVLQGWCPKIRWADKAMHSDFIHTAAGQPIYFETTDNFEDLRVRFFGVVERCRKILGWAKERVLSLVVDRGIFGAEVFAKVLAEPGLHLLTWQKGYKAGEWRAEKVSGKMVLERARNHARDLRSYHFEYIDQDWAQDARLRQLEVRATNPQSQQVQVAILTDDRQRQAEEIVRLLFSRWLQENDFKYLDKHFGINQITSYRSTAYEKLRGQVQDREVQSGEYKALQQQRRQWRAQQARLLLTQQQCDYKAAQRAQRLKELEQRSADGAESTVPVPAETSRDLAKLRAAQQRYESTSQARREQIKEQSQQLSEWDEQVTAVQKKASRLEAMIAAEMVRMEPQSKRLMDSLKVLARNVFYQALQPFKEAYDNYRDDHDYFRQLSLAPGVLEVGVEAITVHLLPKTNYSPQLRGIIEKLLNRLNEQDPRLPDGTGRLLRFRLGRKSELRLSMHLEAG